MKGLVDQSGSMATVHSQAKDDLSLAAKVRILSDPSFYRSTDDVKRIETHFSWVFLVGNAVYKLKKPIKKSYLDLSTTALRRRNCEAEVRLNQRLTRQVYLGVKGLTLDSLGHLQLASSSSARGVLDFLVHQRRLDPSQGMGHLLQNEHLEAAHVEALVRLLVGFYQRQVKVGWEGQTYLSRLHAELAACSQALEKVTYHPLGRVSDLTHHLEHFLVLTARDLTRGEVLCRIVEAHGDLRPEHIFFEKVPQIIDCLEFSYDLRCRDFVDEMAYLAMECDMVGREDVGAYLLDAFCQMAHIKRNPHLEHFYAAYRAFVRAKLVAWRLMNGSGADLERWHDRLGAYMAMTEKYARLL